MPEDDGTDPRLLAERAAGDDSPLRPGFRDGPARTPRSTRALLAETIPFLLLAAVVVLVVAGR
ncbi:hypothetical protein [Cellulomonas sp. IC4_254]|uniref:hypothetical protein n=1 Tax=Cellulomonas sp. IC4_254 TaxID=2714040 RepID=UPI001424040C|nr:hypothetical protein [Cellulomonas sp. IC4_254]NHT16974.1 hypothetical protein [Cellulomonas sp. IC4_254]